MKPLQRYLELTRSPWYGYLFSLPLLALYQISALLANLGSRRQVINGADALVQGLLNSIGLHGWLGSWLLLAAVVGAAIYRLDAPHRKGKPETSYFVPVLLESGLYALLFGNVVAVLTALVLPHSGFLAAGGMGISLGQSVAASLGAGLYEELVFRVLLAGGLIWGLSRIGWKPAAATVTAVLASSLLFSLFHYVGPLGEPFRLTSFTFRFIAGVVLAVLFAVRGFAVAAWTHALYDLFLIFAGRG
jgi:hypothetical protein